MTHLCVVIVTFNRLEKLQRTLRHVLAAQADSVVVVDNACSDGSAEWLDSLRDPRLTVLHLDRNQGGAGGFHHGFSHVLQQGHADWIVCHDDDAWPEASAFLRFRAMLPSLPDTVGGVAAAVYTPQYRICEMNRPSLNPFGTARRLLTTLLQGRMGFHLPDAAYRGSAPADIDCSSFVGCFLRVSTMHRTQLLPRRELFIYADDVLYTYSLRQAGMRMVFLPEIVFIHDCESLEAESGRYTRLWRMYYTYRNGIELYRQLAGRLFPLVMVLKLVSWLLKGRHYPGNQPYYRVLGQAVVDGLRGDFSRSHDDVLKLAAATGVPAAKHPSRQRLAPAPFIRKRLP
ncbi:MAG TPA: glycosyltransferase [Moraxellaceae bacterium]